MRETPFLSNTTGITILSLLPITNHKRIAMLRVMKQKARETAPVEEQLSLPWKIGEGNASDTTRTTVEGLVAPITSPDNHGRIVSHVPVSANTSSSSSLESSNSTISSAQHHVYPQPVPRRGDNETFHGGTTPGALSSEENPLYQRGLKNSATPDPKRNFSLVAEDTGTSASGRETKRLRVAEKSTRLSYDKVSSAAPASHWPRLLSTANDASFLNPLHVFVRQQVEVFQATLDDLKQPAPGRRVPIESNQVGIRCIHCKNKNNRMRKKRAVCFPSAVERIYHSINDMKFAHFPCQEMPLELQESFAALKEESLVQGKLKKESSGTRRTSGTASTAQYYNESAQELGLVNREGGIYSYHGGLSLLTPPSIDAPPISLDKPRSEYVISNAAKSQASVLQDTRFGQCLPPIDLVDDGAAFQDQVAVTKIQKTARTVVAHADRRLLNVAPKLVSAATKSRKETTEETILQATKIPHLRPVSQGTILASALDPQYLAPIHCFVRKHVEAFAATKQDLAAPAPGRKKPVLLGQVGLRCVHCAALPFKQRVKRAICFPPNVGGVYHAISNMKFDHFKLCKGMPQKAREEFEQTSSSLSSATEGKLAKGNIKSRRVSNSTAQYYIDSAFRMGLCDTAEGIRFSNEGAPRDSTEGTNKDPVRQAEGMQALIIAATDAKVRAAHEQRTQQRAAV